MATPEERHPELFRPFKNDSPRGKKREVPMEALALGFNRTGTATMSVALEKLGLHTWHSLLFMSSSLGEITMWNEALDAKFAGKGDKFKRNEWDQLLYNFGAVSSDTPAIAFAQDLIEAYPEAKVVLVERDIDKWYDSFNDNIVYQLVRHEFFVPPPKLKYSQYHPFNNFIKVIDPWFTGPIGNIHHKTMRLWLGASNAQELRAVAKDAYRKHYALVRKVTPPDRLLEFKLKDGWEPLCKFLDKPVPNEPFPHTNEREYLNEKITIQMRKRGKKVLGGVVMYSVPVLAAVAVGWWFYTT